MLIAFGGCGPPTHSYETKVKSLYEVPERIDVKSKSKTEEMLSNQMLSGIPEMDLGLE